MKPEESNVIRPLAQSPQPLESTILELRSQHDQMYDIALHYASEREYLIARYNELAGPGKAEGILKNGHCIIEALKTAVENKYFEPEDGHDQP